MHDTPRSAPAYPRGFSCFRSFSDSHRILRRVPSILVQEEHQSKIQCHCLRLRRDMDNSNGYQPIGGRAEAEGPATGGFHLSAPEHHPCTGVSDGEFAVPGSDGQFYIVQKNSIHQLFVNLSIQWFITIRAPSNVAESKLT